MTGQEAKVRLRNAGLVAFVVFALAWGAHMAVSGAIPSDAAVRTVMSLLGIPRLDESAAATAGARVWELSVLCAGLLLRLYLFALVMSLMLRKQIENQVQRQLARLYPRESTPDIDVMLTRGVVLKRSAWN